MKSFFSNLLSGLFLSTNKLASEIGRPLSPYGQAKAFRVFRVSVLREVRNFLLGTAGGGFGAFGLESFLLPNGFIDGGATGISLLVTEVTKIPISYFLILINLPFVIISARSISRDFALRTSIAIV